MCLKITLFLEQICSMTLYENMPRLSNSNGKSNEMRVSYMSLTTFMIFYRR